MDSTEKRISYLERQRAAGFKVGERVLINRVARDYENGWTNSWPREMNSAVDKVGVIKRDCGAFGLAVEVPSISYVFDYPYFVLTRVGSKPPRSRKGLKVPAYLVAFSFDNRTVISYASTYGRNGNWATAKLALEDARAYIKKNPATLECHIEQGWVTVRLPRKVIND